MNSHSSINAADHCVFSRREFLTRTGTGFGMMALAGLAKAEQPMAPKAPHFAPKAKRVVHLFMNGGPSQVDTFDPKPMLTKLHGQPLPVKNFRTERRTGHAMGSPYSFKQYGQSGLPVSEIFAKTAAAAADDLCVIRSMKAEVPNHEPSLMLMNCGDGQLPRPSFGAWVNYGLGTENENLPGFIAMCPGYPIQESQNWQCAFLPGMYQGTYIDTRKRKAEELIANIRNPRLTMTQQRRQLDLLKRINERHSKARQNEAQLEARIHSFELAYRMQIEATDAFDISREPAHVRKRYGYTAQARQIPIARRLVERGVRYVQVWHGDGQPWDNHDDIAVNHRKLARECDQAIGALLTDLKQRGLLEETLVMWGGEFGRPPTVELPKAGSNEGKN